LDLEANHQGPKGKTKDNHENGREYVGITQTPYRNMMLDTQILRTKKRLAKHKLFLPQEVVFGVKYGLMVFRESTIVNNGFHGEKCNQILTQMSGCNILFNHNLWFRVAEIKIE
jgi:hypothetical protein